MAEKKREDNIGMTRLSLSLEPALAEQLNRLTQSANYENRSEFVRDMIREKLVHERWEQNDDRVLGTYTLIYDHHQRELCGLLVQLQHDANLHILASTHVHVSHEICAEMIMVTGLASEVRRLFNELRKPRGMLHATLGMSSVGDNFTGQEHVHCGSVTNFL